MPYLMSDNCHHFIVVHHFHQSAANANTTITTSKSIHINDIINFEVQVQSVYLDIFGQSFQTLPHFRIGTGHFIMGIHPLDIFPAHSYDIGIAQCNSFSNIGCCIYHLFGVNRFPSDLKLCRRRQTDTCQKHE